MTRVRIGGYTIYFDMPGEMAENQAHANTVKDERLRDEHVRISRESAGMLTRKANSDVSFEGDHKHKQASECHWAKTSRSNANSEEKNTFISGGREEYEQELRDLSCSAFPRE
jgi:hypothetical protein